MNVKLPRLLDRNLVERTRLIPIEQTADIELTPLSVASLTLEEGSEVNLRDFIEVYNSRGSVGIYRVTAKETGCGSNGDVIRLEHGVCVLGDAVIPGESTIEGSAREVLTKFLEYQTAKVGGVAMWTLGDVDVPDTEKISYDNRASVTLHAIQDVLEKLHGYEMHFDQTSFPWIMHIKAEQTTATAEGRLGRNVTTANVTIDDSELCTRVLCSRLEGGSMQLEDDPEWGIVERTLEFDDDVTDEEVEEACREYLELRSEPIVSVEIDGLELAAETGEELDSLEVGKMYRLALPAYDVTVNQRITSISYAAMHAQPEVVRVQLANKLRDASSDLAGLQKKTDDFNSKYGRIINQTLRDVTNLKDTAEGWTEYESKLTHWFNSVEIDLNAEEAQIGALAYRREVTENSEKINRAMLILDGDTETGGSRVGLVAQVEESLGFAGALGERLTSAELILNGEPGSAEAGLVARVERNEEEISRAGLTLYGDETSATAGLVAKVGENAASITSTANELGSKVSIEALEIELQGYVTTEKLTADFTKFGSTLAEDFYAENLSATDLECTNFYYGGQRVAWDEVTVVTGVKNYRGFAVYMQDGSPAIIYGFTDGGNSGMVSRTTIHFLTYE